jgi:hypothetical protein
MKVLGTMFLLGTAAALFSMDTDYSNEQDGVRFRVLGIDSDKPMLRIENTKQATLAIHNDMSLAVSFWNNNGERVHERPDRNPLDGNGLHAANDPSIIILARESNLEIPLRRIYFNTKEPGYGESLNWSDGLKTIAPGRYTVKFTSNSLGMTALGVNFSPFKVNFDIPPFEFEAK